MKNPVPAVTGLLAGLWFLAGCSASIGRADAPQRSTAAPAAAVAPGWQAPVPAITEKPVAGGAMGQRWWILAGDPLLPLLVAEALRDSPTLAAAAARIGSARAGVLQAQAALRPQLGATSGAQRARTSPGAAPLSSASAGLEASWAIDLFGGLAADREAAAARLRSAQAAWHAVRLALAAETATTYTALRACQAQHRLAMDDAASRTETERVTEASARAGLLAPASAALARASAAQARAQASVQLSACDNLHKALVALTGMAEGELRAKLGNAAELPQPGPLPALPLPAALLERRPDLIGAAADIAAATAGLGAAQAQALPRIGLNGSIGLATLSLGGQRSEGLTWNLGPLVLQWPLVDGGAQAARDAQAQAALDQAIAAYAGIARQAVRETEETLVALHATAARSDDARIATEGFAASFRAVESRFKGGLASVFELEDARRSLSAARGALIELQRERMAAWIALHRVLGGGFAAEDLANTSIAQNPR